MIHKQQTPLCIDSGNEVRCSFHQIAILFSALYQLLFRHLSFGDVVEKNYQRSVADRPVLDADFDLEKAPILATVLRFEAALALRHYLLEGRIGSGVVCLQVGDPHGQ